MAVQRNERQKSRNGTGRGRQSAETSRTARRRSSNERRSYDRTDNNARNREQRSSVRSGHTTDRYDRDRTYRRDSSSRSRARREEQRKKRLRRRVRTLVRLSVFVFLFAVAVLLIAVPASLRIESFEVSGNSHYTTEEIIESSKMSIGDNLIFSNRKNAEKIMPQEMPYIEKVDISLKLPSTIKLKVTECIPESVISDGSNLFLISRNSKILEKVDAVPQDIKYIVIAGVEAPEIGMQLQYTDGDSTVILDEILSVLSGYDLDIRAIDISNLFSIKLNYAERAIIKLGDASELDYKIKMAARIISEQVGDDFCGTVNVTVPGNGYVLEDYSGNRSGYEIKYADS